jgi:predicted  nucleic acid-binding Zn-ribbon protein
MGLFDMDTYKSNDWKAENARLSAEHNNAAKELARAQEQREKISDFLMVNSQHKDSFEYKKMQLQLQLMDDEVARKRSSCNAVEYEWEQHSKSW